MKIWLYSIVGVILISSIIRLLIANNHTSKISSLILTFVCSITLIQPILNIKNGNFSLEKIFSYSSEDLIDENVLSYAIIKREELLIKEMENVLQENGIEKCNILIEREDGVEFILKKVKIDAKNAVIKDNQSNIDINKKIKSVIENELNISSEIIEVYA